MIYGIVKSTFKQGLIERVFVLRLPRNPELPRRSRSGRETDFTYLLIFLPDAKRLDHVEAQNYLLYRDRQDERHRPRFFRTLFTVSKAMEEWGVEEYEVLDYSRCKSAVEVFEELKERMRIKGVRFKPAEREIERALDAGMTIEKITTPNRPRTT